MTESKKRTGLIIFIVFIVMAACLYWVKGRLKQEMYFVNGLDRNYAVEVGGQTYTLPAHKETKIPVTDSKVVFKVLDPELSYLSGEVDLLDFELSVINPDKSAFLVWTTFTYGAGPQPQASYDQSIGKLLNSYRQVDYAFVTMPPQLEVSEGTVKTVLQTNPKYPDTRLYLQQVSQRLANNKALFHEIVKTRLKADPNNVHYLSALMGLKPDEFLSLSKDNLNKKPTMVEWHRVYQSYVGQKMPQIDLLAEYQERYSKNPEDPGLNYLLGRLTFDFHEADAYFKKAVASDKPCLWGHMGLAYQYLSRADFEKALEHSTHYKDAKGSLRQSLIKLHEKSMLGLKRYDELIATLQKEVETLKGRISPGQQFVLTGKMIMWNAMKGEKKTCDVVMNGFEKNHGQHAPQWVSSLKAEMAYALGDMESFHKYHSQSKSKSSKILQLIIRGEVEKADKLMTGARGRLLESHLIMSLASHKAGNKELADKYWKMSLDAMKKYGNASHKALVRLFENPKELTYKKLFDIPLDLKEQRLFLTVVGLRFSELKGPCFELAKKLNFEFVYPYHLINEVISS